MAWRKEMISPWSYLTKARSEFSTLCSLCPLSSVYESQSVPCMFCLCVSVCLVCNYASLCVYLCLCVCPSQRPLFNTYWTTQKASHGEGLGHLTEIFNRALQGAKSLAPTDPAWPDNIVYQPVSVNGCFQPLWQVFGSCFQFLYCCLQLMTHVLYSGQGNRRVQNWRLQLRIS